MPYRNKALIEQNNALHVHLESVTSQATRIRTVAAASEGSEGVAVAEGSAELQGVVSFLRKEKEIIELQLDLSKQENTRLKTQIDHLAQNLEEAQKALSEVSDQRLVQGVR